MLHTLVLHNRNQCLIGTVSLSIKLILVLSTAKVAVILVFLIGGPVITKWGQGDYSISDIPTGAEYLSGEL